MGLQETLEKVLKTESATFGVYVKHLESEETAAINGVRLFQSASCFKVPILARVFHEVEQGNINLFDRVQLKEEDRVPGSGVFKEFIPGVEVTIHDLITMMIIVSDNMATDKVLQIVGREQVDHYMKELGLNDTYIYHSCWELLCHSAGLEPQPYTSEFYQDFKIKLDADADLSSIIFQERIENNVTTPSEMGELLERIATGNLISKQACEAMFTILSKQQYTQRIPHLIPPEAIVGNKTGTIGDVVNDLGIIKLPENKGTLVVVVFSKGNKEEAEAAKRIAELSKAAYDYFAK